MSLGMDDDENGCRKSGENFTGLLMSFPYMEKKKAGCWRWVSTNKWGSGKSRHVSSSPLYQARQLVKPFSKQDLKHMENTYKGIMKSIP